MTNAETLYNAAKQGVELNLKIHSDDLIPTLLVYAKSGIELYVIGEEDKEKIPPMILTTLVDRQVDAYALVLEAWVTPFMEKAKKYDYKVRDMPPDDKSEVVQVFAVQRNQGCVGYTVSQIERLDTGKRRLVGWEERNPEGVFGPFVITNW